MTAFGWIYLILTVIAGFNTINEIGKPRKPLTQAEAATRLLASGLLFWALYAWGLNG